MREELLRLEYSRAQYELGVFRAIVEALERGDSDAVTRLLPAARLALAKKTKRMYSPAFRRAALRAVAIAGASAVSRRWGVNLRTLQSWCNRAGVASRGLYSPRKRRRHRSWESLNAEYASMLERKDERFP